MNFKIFKILARFALFSILLNIFAPVAAPAHALFVSVVVSPTSATVNTNATQQITATVTGATNGKVVWTVNDVEGGNPQIGTVSTGSLYMAPAIVPANPTVSVKATSWANRSVSATSLITIQNSAPPQTGASANRFLNQTTFGTTTGFENARRANRIRSVFE